MNSHDKMDEDFHLTKAEFKQYAIHYATYRENIFFRQSWERRLTIFDADASCYWIMFKGRRIGGVCMEPNSLSGLFLEPPFVDMALVLTKLKRLLLQCSDANKPIHAYGILPYQTEHFLRLGFIPAESRRVMIRPTERFEPQEWEEGFVIINPAVEQLDQMAEQLFESYSGTDRIGYPAENTIEEQRASLEYYFENNNSELLNRASSIIIDKSNNQLVAVCLISLWEDLPLISDIAVLPEYRSKQFASKLLKHASTTLFEQYDVMRLFVTIGNAAESLYYNFGFYPGLEQTTFRLSYRSR